MYNALLKIIRPHGFLVGDSAPQTLEYKKSPRQLLHCRGLIFCIVSADGSMLLQIYILTDVITGSGCFTVINNFLFDVGVSGVFEQIRLHSGAHCF